MSLLNLVEKIRPGLLCVIAIIWITGCNKPCDDFAQLTCTTAGEETPACTKAREYAARAPGVEQQVCAQALELAQALKRK